MTEMCVAKAREYGIGLIWMEDLEPTEDFRSYLERKSKGKDARDLMKHLDKKLKAKGENGYMRGKSIGSLESDGF